MIINFSTDKFVERFIPLHKVKPVRLKWLRFLLSELKAIWEDFYAWRKDYYYRLNINGQTMLLQYHLNKVIAGANDSIRVVHYDDQSLKVGLESEGVNSVNVGLIDVPGEENAYVLVALEGEVQQSIGVDFRISVPAGVNVNAVAGEVDTYKLGGKSYEIIQG